MAIQNRTIEEVQDALFRRFAAAEMIRGDDLMGGVGSGGRETWFDRHDPEHNAEALAGGDLKSEIREAYFDVRLSNDSGELSPMAAVTLALEAITSSRNVDAVVQNYMENDALRGSLAAIAVEWEREFQECEVALVAQKEKERREAEAKSRSEHGREQPFARTE